MIESTEQIAAEAAKAAADKKASDIVVLDIRDLTPIADYFVICSANSGTQIEAVSTAVRDRLEQLGVRCRGTEGMRETRWVLLDFGDVVVHVFRTEDRDFYRLERVWGDARRISYEVAGASAHGD